MFECVQKLIKIIINRTYEFSPPQVRLIWAFFFDLLIDTYLIRGKDEGSLRNIYVAVGGESPWVYYIVDNILDNTYEKEYWGKCPIFQIPNSRFFDREGVNLIIVRINKFFGKFLEKRGFVKIPEWIDFEERLYRFFGFNRYFGELERKRYFENRGYTYQIRNQISDFNYFYYNMYLPYVKKRFGEIAYIHSYTYLRRIFNKGFLLFVFRESILVSGLLYYVKHNIIYFNNIGVEKGDFNLLKAGALEAVYYFFIKMAKIRYVSDYTINFGGGRPFLNDGLFQYKKKWASHIVKRTKNPYNFYLLFRNDRYFAEFIKRHPFVSLKEE